MSEAPIPAATLVVLRDTLDGIEALMVERAASLAFAAGALVFPGGRVDPGDREIAAQIGSEVDEVAHRIAAIRETIEEAGLAVAADAALLAHRDALLNGEPPETLLPPDALDPDALVPFARWLPTGMPHRIFDTRFYLARASEGGTEASPDGGENVRCLWIRPDDALKLAARGEARIIFPTRRNLERLAGYENVDAALADARERRLRTITPWIEDRGGVPHLCIPDDLGYPVTAEPTATAARA